MYGRNGGVRAAGNESHLLSNIGRIGKRKTGSKLTGEASIDRDPREKRQRQRSTVTRFYTVVVARTQLCMKGKQRRCSLNVEQQPWHAIKGSSYMCLFCSFPNPPQLVPSLKRNCLVAPLAWACSSSASRKDFPCLFQYNSSSSTQRVYLPVFPRRLPRPFPLSKSPHRYTVNTYHGEMTVYFILFSRIRYEFLELDTFSRSEHMVQE